MRPTDAICSSRDEPHFYEQLMLSDLSDARFSPPLQPPLSWPLPRIPNFLAVEE